MELIELKEKLIVLQSVDESLYKKIENVLTQIKGRAKLTMDLADGRIAYIEMIFKNIEELKKVNLEPYIKVKKNWVKLENQQILRYSYFNYLTNKYETKTEHPDFSYPSPKYSLQKAIVRIDKKYGYLIATIKNPLETFEPKELENA